ncbi:MAG: hypothetical protein IJ193_05770 [Bacilli bacterium]|nr:hypothetical protein [Bacilli bacterium]
MNDLVDQYRYLVGGYYGMCLMDEYPLKEFVLQDIKNYVIDFIEINPIDDFDYKEEANIIKDTYSDRVKLQDLLLVLNKINAKMEIVFLVKAKLRELGRRDNF